MLDFSNCIVIRLNLKSDAKMLPRRLTLFERLFQYTRIRPHQTASSQQRPAKIPCDDCRNIANAASEQHLQHRAPRSTAWLSVIAASGELRLAAKHIR